MESNIALVYMTLNMIYYIIFILFNSYYIIYFFNNFLNQRSLTAFFSHFLVLLKEHFSFPLFRCTEPNPEDRRSEGIRIANEP